MPDSITNLLLTLQIPQVEAALKVSIPTAASTSVAQLTRGLSRGDECAFREFHALYFDRLYQFLLVIARGQEDEAQEALQETLLRVLRYGRPFETEDAFWCWLKVVARSAARDRGRKQQRYLLVLKKFAIGLDNRTQETDEEDQRLRFLVEEGLAELNPADRLLIQGKYFEGETVNELSLKTGLTDRAVESRLLRLRRQLRERVLRKLHSL